MGDVARLGALVAPVAPNRGVSPLANAPSSTASEVGPPAPSVPKRGSRALGTLAAGIVLGLGAVGASVLGAKFVRTPGVLLVTVSAPGTSEATGIEVFVDGVVRCASSPCRIAALEPGTHFVKVRGRGYEESASLAVTVERGAQSAVQVGLSRAASPPPPPVAASAAPDVKQERTVLSVAQQPKPERRPVAPPVAERAAEPNRAPAAASATAKPAADDAQAFGTLRIVSLPVSRVLVDGRPVGSTPQILRVSPGSHRVALLLDDDRRVQVVDVAPGGTEVVSVRF